MRTDHTEENAMLTPDVYLSTSNGAWRVICRGSPLCADTSRERAESVARHYGKKPEEMQIWDGDNGRFVEGRGK